MFLSDIHLYNVANPKTNCFWCIMYFIIRFLYHDIICANIDQEFKINTM